MGRQRGRAKDKLFWWVLQYWNKYNHPRGLCDSVWHFGYFFFMPPDVINLAGGARGEAHTYFYCILISARKKKSVCFVLFGFFSSHSIRHCAEPSTSRTFTCPLPSQKLEFWGLGADQPPHLQCSREKTPKLKEDVRGSCAALLTLASIRTREQIWPITS